MNRAGDGGMRRVLVARLDSLGDVLLAWPTAGAAAARVRLTMLVRTGLDEAAGLLPAHDVAGALWL
jgi:ADP-heptose:LPS heptosyltransferase